MSQHLHGGSEWKVQDRTWLTRNGNGWEFLSFTLYQIDSCMSDLLQNSDQRQCVLQIKLLGGEVKERYLQCSVKRLLQFKMHGKFGC